MILTLDKEFTRLARQLHTSVGVILISTHPQTPARITHLLSIMLSKIRIDKHVEDLVVITESGIRIGASSK